MPLTRRALSDTVRREPVAGALLVGAAVLALAWANSPWSASYDRLSSLRVGPASLQLDLSLASWASDGLLAVFFFVAGLELTREVVAGDLRDPARALLPVGAAVGGMIVPAAIFVAINAGGPGLAGWAVPTATDIAFALAVLAIVAPHGPPSRRTFLLTLAVVDDLLAITIIAVAYTDELSILWLLLALVPLTAFAVLIRRRPGWWWLLVPLAVLTWGLVHASGVHATVAGVLLGAVVPVTGGTAARVERWWRPWSSGVAVPVFAFFAAGVTVAAGAGGVVSDPVTWGVVLGLVVGKAVGVGAAVAVLRRLTRARLAEDLRAADVAGLGLLAGVGFTVSLLIGELAFGAGTPTDDHVKIGVLVASVLAATLAAVVLRAADRR